MVKRDAHPTLTLRRYAHASPDAYVQTMHDASYAGRHSREEDSWARMHGKWFFYPVGKRYPEGSYLGGKNLVWFACMSHGRAGR